MTDWIKYSLAFQKYYDPGTIVINVHFVGTRSAITDLRNRMLESTTDWSDRWLSRNTIDDSTERWLSGFFTLYSKVVTPEEVVMFKLQWSDGTLDG